MALTQWQEKYLLEEEIEIFLQKEFVFAVNCCVRGYHIFKSFWDAPIGSILSAKHEDDPQSLVHDKYAIALIVSWLQWVISQNLCRNWQSFLLSMLGKLGVKLQVKKTLFRSRAGWFGDSSKNNISEFKRKNNLRNEKETCSSYWGI